MRSDRYTFFFATAVCVVCSVLLAMINTGLKPIQERNIAIDKKKNILISLALYDAEAKLSSSQIEQIYSEKITEKVLTKEGNEAQGKTIEEGFQNPELFPLFYRKDDGSFAIPVKGMGLWDIIEGYLALKNDGKTVMGVTFYEQKETAGLGAEIQTEWFIQSFTGKRIVDENGNLSGVAVAKGKAAESNIPEANAVDGISGATLTGRGVTNLLLQGIQTYKSYLTKVWEAAQ